MAIHQHQKIPQFNLNGSPLDGVNLIEASAGTGKTYTIEAIFIRLIIEKGMPVSRILVVTFTEAATEELKGRIRSRISQVMEFLSGPADDAVDDAFLHQLYQANPDKQQRLEAVKKLRDALRDFDESAIFTIHGFCHRMLREHAFESGTLFDTELVSDQTRLLQEISEDFWRNHFYSASPLFVRYAMQKTGPDDFQSLLKKGRLMADIRILPPADAPDFSPAEAAFSAIYKKLRKSWPADRQAVESILLNDKGLNRNKYRVKSVSNCIEALDQYLEPQNPRPGLFKDFFKFTVEGLEDGTKKKHAVPSHPFFALCSQMLESHQVLTDAYDRMLVHLKQSLFDYAREQTARRKQQANVQTFDDLLVNLKNALNSDSGPALAESIRERYQGALIDEFQDTDPIQYDIFHTLFKAPGHILFLIGDPKQAIYSFRGADIFAYMAAAFQAEYRYTLGTNWRSSPPLIRAVNTLFSGHDRAFVYPEIPFQPVRAPEKKADDPGIRIDGEPQSPFYVWVPASPDKPVSKENARRMITRSAAGKISHLLDLGRQGRAMLEGKPVRPGHIAVLVRRNREAEEMQEALRVLGIPGVLFNTGDIFDTPEAVEMAQILAAIANPSVIRLMKTCLASDMLGLTGEALEALSADEPKWDAWLIRFAEYRQAWVQRGFIRMFRQFLAREAVLNRLMALPDGERRCTNILHLSELLHQASLLKKGGPSELLVWFSEQRHQGERRPEEHPLRLESDDNAVKLVTVHKSKGLEYPIVFCPFFWDGSTEQNPGKGLVYYDEACDRRLTLDLGSREIKEHQQMLEKQNLAENLRLLYVALTRAKNQCCMAWGRINKAGTSAPFWLLHGRGIDGSEKNLLSQLDARFKGMDDPAMARTLEKLSAASSGTIRISPLPEEEGLPYRQTGDFPVSLDARPFPGQIPRDYTISSFSSLTRRHQYNPELADYDDVEDAEPGRGMEEALEAVDVFGEVPGETPDESSGEQEDAWSRFAFPRGAQPGTCLHEIFEHLDFTQSTSETAQTLIPETLQKYGFDPQWQGAVSDIVQNTLTAALDPGQPDFRLSAVSSKQRINEMEFYFPLQSVTSGKLGKIFSSFREKGSGENDFSKQIRDLSMPKVEGLMKGFIDLIFQYKGRYYLLDWKSNHLGDRVEDYGKEALSRAMAEHFYILQYHIYTVALHRYLMKRVKQYEYGTHFGGVFYLFLRGMAPDRPEGFGIFRDRPGFELIDALDQAMTQKGNE